MIFPFQSEVVSQEKFISQIPLCAWKKSQSKLLVKKLDTWGIKLQFFWRKVPAKMFTSIKKKVTSQNKQNYFSQTSKATTNVTFFFLRAFSFVFIFLINFLALNNCPHSWVGFPNFQEQLKQCNLFLEEEKPKPTKKGIAKNQNSSHQQAGTFFRQHFFFVWVKQ